MSVCVVWGQQEGTGRRLPGILGHQRPPAAQSADHTPGSEDESGGRETDQQAERQRSGSQHSRVSQLTQEEVLGQTKV